MQVAVPVGTNPIATATVDPAGAGAGEAQESKAGNHNHDHDHDHDHKHSAGWFTLERRLYGVVLIAFGFMIAELIIGFTNNALVLVADAFHISSDLIGYIVSIVCIRLGSRPQNKDAQAGFTFGLQRAQLLGGAFNGVFLLALGVSVILQSVDRFINTSEIQNAKLVIIIGAAGIASNLVMVALLGGHHGHSHSHGPTDEIALQDAQQGPGEPVHTNHAHAVRTPTKKGRFDLNIFGVLLHILGDGINSVAVIVSGVVYMKTGWKYADPIASLLVGFMIIGTALPLTLQSGRMLAQAAPRDVDLKGVLQDVAAVEGVEGVHELHVWSLTQSKVIAAVHLVVGSNSLLDFAEISRKVQSCLHFWGIHAVTIQPELSDSNSGEGHTIALSSPATTCRMRCPSQFCDEACC